MDPLNSDGALKAPWQTACRRRKLLIIRRVSHCAPLRDEDLLLNLPDRNMILSYFGDNATVFDCLLEHASGRSQEYPFGSTVFRVKAHANRIPGEVFQLGCEGGPSRPHGLLTSVGWRPLSTSHRSSKVSTSFYIHQATIEVRCSHPEILLSSRSFSTDIVGVVASLGRRGCFQGSLDETSMFHHVLLHPHF